MAIKALNSIGGFSVGDTPANIILANGDITTINFTSNGTANLGNVGNVKIGGGTSGYVLSTDGVGNLSWAATGSPTSIHNENSNVSIPLANSNIYINANSGTNQQWAFETTGNTVFPSTGTANLGNLVIANYANFANDVVVQGNISNANNISVTNNITTNTANLTGNLTGTYANFANDVAILGNISNVNNISITLNLEGNTANFSGNIKSLNANLGNLAIANYANLANDLVVQGNIANANNISVTNNITTNTANLTGNLTGTYANLANDLVVQGNIANANNISVTNNITSDTANVTGNLTAGNVDGGNLVKANNFSTNGTGGDITLTGGDILGANVTYSNSFTSNGGTVDFATNNPNVKLGNVGNVHIGGGSSGYLLSTDGAGNLSWSATASTNNIYNGNSNVSIPTTDGNVYINANAGSDSQWVFNTDGNLSTPGNISLGGNTITDNSGGDGIQLYSGADYAQLNYNDSSYVYVRNDGVWLETTSGTLNLDTSGNVIISNDLEVQGNIANAGNISVTNAIAAGSANITNDLDVGGNIVTGTGSGGNISGVNYITANVANITNVVNTGVIANGTSNIRLATNGNVTISSNSLSNVFTFSDLGANVIGYIQANGIISAGGFVGSNLVSNVGILSLQAKQIGGNYNINLLAGGTGNIDVGTTYITSVKDPLNAQDAATKAYVDSVAQGLDVKASVQYATAAALPSYTYNNGTSGVGATITANANGALTIDGGSPAATQRVLIKDETAGNNPYNGIYVVTDAGGVGTPFILTRATDFDSGSPSGEIPGAFTFVEQGSTNADSGWVCTTNNPVTVGTTPIVFVQFSSAGSYSANTSAGLVLIGTQFNAKVDGVTTDFIGGNIAVKTSANLITPNIGAANGTSLDLSGNLLAGNVNSNAAITAVDATFSGNITTTGASGNISGANVIFADSFTSNGGTVDFATNNANVLLGNVGNVHVYGGSASQVLITDGAGNLSWTSTPNITIIQNGTSNVTIPTSNGNVITDVNGNATLTVTGTGANITGYANISGNLTSGNANLGNVATANTVSVTNVNVGNSIITSQTTTTLSTSANQTIATFTVTGTSVVGVEFFVKGDEAAGFKYSVAMVQAVTDGVDVDYAIYGGVRLGGTTGSLAVNMTSAGGNTNINLQATPSSSNSTVWTTQIRLV